MHKAIGDQLTCIFVNNGLLRGREAGVVQEVFGRHFKIKLQYEDATKLFLRRLKGVTDPERKRKIIGRTFIEVFQCRHQTRGQGAVSRAGDAVSRRDRICADRGQSRRDDQEPSQCGWAAEEDEISAR